MMGQCAVQVGVAASIAYMLFDHFDTTLHRVYVSIVLINMLGLSLMASYDLIRIQRFRCPQQATASSTEAPIMT